MAPGGLGPPHPPITRRFTKHTVGASLGRGLKGVTAGERVQAPEMPQLATEMGTLSALTGQGGNAIEEEGLGEPWGWEWACFQKVLGQGAARPWEEGRREHLEQRRPTRGRLVS